MDSPGTVKQKQIMTMVLGIGLIVGLLVFGMWLSDPNRGKPSPMEIAKAKQNEVRRDFTAGGSSVISAEESWIALSDKRLKALDSENKALREQLKEIATYIKQQKSEPPVSVGASTPVSLPNEGTGLLDSPVPEKKVGLPPPPDSSRELSRDKTRGAIIPPERGNDRVPPPRPSQLSTPRRALVDEDGNPISQIQVVSLSKGPTNSDGEASTGPNVKHYLPTGSFATAVLLSGVDAPTGGQATSNPIPVLLRLIDDGQLPNFFNSDVDNCHVTGAAYGDIASERANIRLETLTCILVNGDVIEEGVKGYVSGEDGKAGLRGRVVNKQGALIAKSLLAGLFSGIGNSVADQFQSISTSALGNVTTVDPSDIAEAGLATGTSNALEKIADFYIARANEIYPIIVIDANRIGEIILTGGTDLKRELIGNTREGS